MLVGRGVEGYFQPCTYSAAELPVGMGSLADPWKMGVGGARVAPSEEPAALDPEVP